MPWTLQLINVLASLNLANNQIRTALDLELSAGGFILNIGSAG